MRFVFLLSASVFVFSFVSYWYQSTAHICPTPIEYRLGEIDIRFGLDPQVALASAQSAEDLWEKAIGKNLFVYAERSDFVINFIYDERQQKARTEEEWRISLDQAENENRDLMEKIKELSQVYEESQNNYNEDRAAYERELNSYNQEVERYNEEGGAPPEVHASLQKEAMELASGMQDLNKREQQLKVKAEEVNRLVEAGNEKVTSYNAEVEEYNAMFGNLDTFTQGDFGRDRINVYKFTNADELTAVLTHEFGHALGIGHVEGESSIMYYLMTERNNSTLSKNDKEAYYQVCGTETNLAQEIRRFIRMVLAKV